MGTLYIDRKGYHIKLDGEAIAFYLDGKREGVVPVRPLSRVIIAGSNTIETSVLNKLADNGCNVIFLSGRGLQYRGVLTGRLHNNGILRVKQYEKSLNMDFALKISKEIVTEKLEKQREFLGEAIKIRGSENVKASFCNVFAILENIAQSITSGCGSLESLRGYEGAASNAYFSAFTELFPEPLGFKTRTRRPPKDPVNAMLSLCYTLLHYEAVREIQVAGLDPTIGFYHCFDYGRESLACDLIEPFRPAADRFVWEMFKDGKCTQKIFLESDYNTNRFMTFLRAYRQKVQIDVLKRLLKRQMPERYVTVGLKEEEYQQVIDNATSRHRGRFQQTHSAISAVFIEMVTGKLIASGLDPHMGVMHRRLDFGLALDICHILGPEMDIQSVQFFCGKTGADRCISKEVSSEDMKAIAVRFENRREALAHMTEHIIDGIFELIRELRTGGEFGQYL